MIKAVKRMFAGLANKVSEHSEYAHGPSVTEIINSYFESYWGEDDCEGDFGIDEY